MILKLLIVLTVIRILMMPTIVMIYQNSRSLPQRPRARSHIIGSNRSVLISQFEFSVLGISSYQLRMRGAGGPPIKWEIGAHWDPIVWRIMGSTNLNCNIEGIVEVRFGEDVEWRKGKIPLCFWATKDIYLQHESMYVTAHRASMNLTSLMRWWR